MSNQQPRMFRREGTTPTEIRYLLYLPRRFDAESGERYPLVLFLHGSGERGDDLGKLKRTGLPEFLERSDEYPFVVVSPQCPRDEDWEDVDLSALLDEATGLYAADPDRVYLTGLSMGGFGAWELATARPDASLPSRRSAAVAIRPRV
ncbi:MAG: alpha/beta fold hydrolase [Chloroflexia bacterium]